MQPDDLLLGCSKGGEEVAAQIAKPGHPSAMARRQTVLELGTTKGPTRSLRLDCSRSRRSRWDARIIAGAESIVTNTLSGGITKTGRERVLSAGRNETPVDAGLSPTRLSAEC